MCVCFVLVMIGLRKSSAFGFWPKDEEDAKRRKAPPDRWTRNREKGALVWCLEHQIYCIICIRYKNSVYMCKLFICNNINMILTISKTPFYGPYFYTVIVFPGLRMSKIYEILTSTWFEDKVVQVHGSLSWSSTDTNAIVSRIIIPNMRMLRNFYYQL